MKVDFNYKNSVIKMKEEKALLWIPGCNMKLLKRFRTGATEFGKVESGMRPLCSSLFIWLIVKIYEEVGWVCWRQRYVLGQAIVPEQLGITTLTIRQLFQSLVASNRRGGKNEGVKRGEGEGGRVWELVPIPLENY